ncbi:Kunitz/Bovine pancreatic trypsin inhibitor domain protein [Ancylostoma duodenale]|uniref:Kunitz/Bovine pancreatic trypsin inhibitor domain protein n=1 Tax=Ancylostoma duodenale TaxID=51022 RepID=A0A0C2GJN3_9BILA|nr:Kunitz/Bovine pancreatic trypsin inhibitor domain protein [Ancylostoma duodenale]
MYNGCKGNGNRFETAAECKQICIDGNGSSQLLRNDPNADLRASMKYYVCNLRYDSGKFAVGGEKSDRYFYTSQYKTCMRFSYYGTLGNENNFPDYNSCMRMCGAQQ